MSPGSVKCLGNGAGFFRYRMPLPNSLIACQWISPITFMLTSGWRIAAHSKARVV